MKIVVVGSLNMDLVVRLPKIPKPGETLLGGIFNTYPGGKGANQAVAAARLGANVFMVGCVGDDAFGWEMRQKLTKEGIDTTHLHIHPELSTGVALIEVDDNAQNSIAVASGANYRLTGVQVEKAIQSIGEFDALIMQLETPYETIFTAAKIASGKGVKVILNPAPAQKLHENLLKTIDILIPNEFEIAAISEIPIKSLADTHRAAEKMLAQGVKNVIVTLGNKGSIFYDGKTKTKKTIPALNVQAVDTTAAGDCFVGALAVRLCEGKTISDAARFASSAAAISVTRIGAQPSLPSYSEVIQLMQERKINK